MDMSIIRDVFASVLEAAEILACRDDSLCQKIRETLPKLAVPKIGPEGELLEYGEAFEEFDIHHRHLSHLYGVYPGAEITPEKTPELFRAAEVALRRRGDASTGWAMGWRFVLWTRFHNGNHACQVFRSFLRPVDPDMQHIEVNGGGIYPNCFDAHPPFQIDGNFGITAGISEMFVQSHKRTEKGEVMLELYPALPDNWTEGCFKGIRAQGGIRVNLEWNRNSLNASLLASSNQTIAVVFPKHTLIVKMKKGVEEKVSQPFS